MTPTHPNEERESQWLNSLTSHLDTTARALEEAESLRLSRARFHALHCYDSNAQPRAFVDVMKALSGPKRVALALSVMLVVFILGVNDSPRYSKEFSMALEVIGVGEDLKMLEEDVEFYRWLETQSLHREF